MGTTTSFDITQTAFLFNLIANASSATPSPNNPQAQADLVCGAVNGTANLANNPFPDLNYAGLLPSYGNQLLGGDWTLTWGPGVYQSDATSGKADNTAYVVQSKSLNTYIVAIAGTDPAAFQDWLLEDLQVGPEFCVNWKSFSPTGATPTTNTVDWLAQQISLGTALGVWALGSQLVQSSKSPTPGVTLASYLTSINGTAGVNILFTGHSLGGALSPTLANWLKGNSTTKATIIAMPTAGPTPGNEMYQLMWDGTFPQLPVTDLKFPAINSTNSVACFNGDVWNEDDVVPHAWQYIYSLVNGPLPTNDPHYFTSVSSPATALYAALGQLASGDAAKTLAAAAGVAQAAGDGARMWRAKYTIPFPTVWPFNTITKTGGIGVVVAPQAPIEIPTLLDYLAQIHVWGYGSIVFGVDISVFQTLHPQPAQS